MPDLLDLLKSGTKRHSQCYTCNHPTAKSLTGRLMAALRAEQQEGRMLSHTVMSVFRVMVEECGRQETPYTATKYAFRNHVRDHLHE